MKLHLPIFCFRRSFYKPLISTSFLYLCLLLFVACPLSNRSAHASSAMERVEGMYCGKENCYALLNITRDATTEEIKAKYREMVLKVHPDRSSNSDDNFKKVAKAYEVLKDPNRRGAYNYFLDHPHDIFGLLMSVRAEYPIRMHPVFAIFMIFGFISLAQYLHYRLKRQKTLKHLREKSFFTDLVNKTVKRMQQEAGNEGDPKILHKRAELAVLYEQIRVDNARFRPFGYKNIAFVQMFYLPSKTWEFMKFFIRWHWRHTFQKIPYDFEEKEYLTRRSMGITEEDWTELEPNLKTRYMSKEVWNAAPSKKNKKLVQKK